MSSDAEKPLPLAGVPLPLTAGQPAAAPRGLWLRLTLFAMLLGAVLTVLYAWVLSQPAPPLAGDAGGVASLRGVVVPLMALVAIAGVLLLERAAVLGVVLMLLGAGVSLVGGAAWLAPGALLGCTWAARRHGGARRTLGYLLLLPGVAFGYYGMLSTLSYASGLPVYGLPPTLAEPATLAQAMAPLELLPIAVLGAWLLLRPLPGHEAR